MINPWAILGVHRQSLDQEIRDAFYAVAQYVHPDKVETSRFRDVAKKRTQYAELWQAANEAYSILKDRKKCSAFIKEMMITCSPCAACDTNGAVRRSAGLLKFTLICCKSCFGAGFIIKNKRKFNGRKGEKPSIYNDL